MTPAPRQRRRPQGASRPARGRRRLRRRQRPARPPAVLLVGPTGSGKTPLGKLLEERGLWGRACRHFDFGEQLRRAAAGDERAAPLTASETEFLRGVLRDGALLEDEQFPIAEKILRAFLRRGGPGWLVLNGLPRHVGQAADVDRLADVRAVVELTCGPETVLARIRSDAGGDRAGRDDDGAEAVASRLRTFAQRTAPLVEHYRRLGARIETVPVAADTSPEQAWQKLSERG